MLLFSHSHNFERLHNIPLNCHSLYNNPIGYLMFLMPDGIVLHCNNCDKYFKNDNGKAGKERKAPVYKKGVLY